MERLRRTWRIVRSILLRIGRTLGLINTTILLTFSFYVILLPTALLWRIQGKNRQPAGWRKRPPLPPDHFSQQY